MICYLDHHLPPPLSPPYPFTTMTVDSILCGILSVFLILVKFEFVSLILCFFCGSVLVARTSDWRILHQISKPRTSSIDFSPKGTHLGIWEPYAGIKGLHFWRWFCNIILYMKKAESVLAARLLKKLPSPLFSFVACQILHLQNFFNKSKIAQTIKNIRSLSNIEPVKIMVKSNIYYMVLNFFCNNAIFYWYYPSQNLTAVVECDNNLNVSSVLHWRNVGLCASVQVICYCLFH